MDKNIIMEISSLVDFGITTYLEKTHDISIGRYESIVESHIIINLCIRHLESINELAKSDLLYLPSAMVLSRSLFESAVTALWLLYPNDIFECESRYVGRLEKYETTIKSLISYYKTQNWGTENLESHLIAFCSFKESLKKLLIDKGYPIRSVPSIREILKSINEERKYLHYKNLSDYTHSDYNSTWLYRKNLGSLKEFGEFIDLNDWKLIYAVSWPVFEIATELFVDRATNSQIKNLYSEDFKSKIRKLINV